MKKLFRGPTGKVLLSVAALGTAAAMAGLGTFATFTSTTSANQTVASGTVVIALGATGAATNRLTLNASGLVPGDTVARAFDLANTGTQNLASIGLTTTASPSSLLDSDATNGLQMVVDKCSTVWVEVGTTPAFTYTCAGSVTSVIATRAVIGNAISVPSVAPLTAGGTEHMRVTLTLPAATGNTFQGLSSTITYSFLGTQRAATSQ